MQIYLLNHHCKIGANVQAKLTPIRGTSKETPCDNLKSSIPTHQCADHLSSTRILSCSKAVSQALSKNQLKSESNRDRICASLWANLNASNINSTFQLSPHEQRFASNLVHSCGIYQDVKISALILHILGALKIIEAFNEAIEL